MVVSRDLDLSGLQMFDWMIPAMMSKFELVGLPTQRDSSQLMPQANSEDRLASHQPADGIDRVGTRFGVPRPIRQENAVRLQREHIFGWRLRRDDRHFAALAAQLAQNVLLDAEVVRDHVE